MPVVPKEECYFFHYCGQDNCQECQESGRYYIADRQFIKKTGIPMAYLPADYNPIDNIYSNPYLARYGRALLHDVKQGKGLYLWSDSPGSGKTSTACLLLVKYLANSMVQAILDEKTTPVLYLNTVELLDKLRANMNTPDPGFMAMWDEQFTSGAPDLLLLDDIGAEKPSEWVRERLYSLINYRISNKLATIYTSNLSPSKLEIVLGPRVASRVFCNNNLVVRMIETDRRRANG